MRATSSTCVCIVCPIRALAVLPRVSAGDTENGRPGMRHPVFALGERVLGAGTGSAAREAGGAPLRSRRELKMCTVRYTRQ